MDKLSALAKERDAYRTGTPATDEEWRALMERARCLFREAALPLNVSRLLSMAFFVRNLPRFNTETVLARVL
jgi:hypothetical protein